MYLVAVLYMLSAAAAVSINEPKPGPLPPPLAQPPSLPLDINEVQHLKNHDGYKDGGAKEVTVGDIVTSFPLKVSEAQGPKEPPQKQFEIDDTLYGNDFEESKKGDASKELNKQHNFNGLFNPDNFRHSGENDRKDFEPTDLPPLVKKPSRISNFVNWLFNLLPFPSSRDNQNHDDVGDHFRHIE